MAATSPPTPPPPQPARRHWLGWTLAATLLGLMPLLALTALWLAMPLWFARLVVAHSPWFEPVFLAMARHVNGRATDPEVYDLDHWAPNPVALTIAYRHVDSADQRRRCAAAILIANCIAPDGYQDAPPAHLLPAHVLPALHRLLADPDPFARIQAAQALGKMQDATCITTLIPAMTGIPADLREMADEALVYFPHPEVTDLLLARPLPGIETAYARALCAMKDPRAIARLVELIAHPSSRIRATVVAASSVYPQPAMTEALGRACLDAESRVRGSALQELQKRSDMLPVLIGLLDQPLAAKNRADVVTLLEARAAELTPEQRERLRPATKAKVPPAP